MDIYQKLTSCKNKPVETYEEIKVCVDDQLRSFLIKKLQRDIEEKRRVIRLAWIGTIQNYLNGGIDREEYNRQIKKIRESLS